jgi:hypothetical protein
VGRLGFAAEAQCRHPGRDPADGVVEEHYQARWMGWRSRPEPAVATCPAGRRSCWQECLGRAAGPPGHPGGAATPAVRRTWWRWWSVTPSTNAAGPHPAIQLIARACRPLQDLAHLPRPAGYPPRRIEGYDISHIQGSDAVASQVVFVDGLARQTALPPVQDSQRLRCGAGHSDDFASMAEVIGRRFRRYAARARPTAAWATPTGPTW